MKTITASLILILFSTIFARAEDPAKLVAHEWGTFTSLQDEQGQAISGINADDEPVPNFVHSLAYYLMLHPQPAGSKFPELGIASKGITPRCHPDVTMRLETPVIYFYPPVNWKPQPVDVHVSFPGGWLSEFYPNADFKAPGFDKAHPGKIFSNDNRSEFGGIGHINKDENGELLWKGLAVGVGTSGPETNEKVWLAPRDVKSAMVKTTGGETEKFLFYRGVGNKNASLRIVQDKQTQSLKISDNGPEGLVIIRMLPDPASARIHAAWLVDVRPDGSCAFKSTAMADYGKEPRATLPLSFASSDYSSENMSRLKDAMRDALVNEGLFSDEADALLKTWEVSYFKSPGTRFFYLCPRIDVDAALPLQIFAPATITRVMIGRIEIVTPSLRESLEKFAANPTTPAYMQLGRFRNALILDQQKRAGTDALAKFIQTNDIGPCKVE